MSFLIKMGLQGHPTSVMFTHWGSSFCDFLGANMPIPEPSCPIHILSSCWKNSHEYADRLHEENSKANQSFKNCTGFLRIPGWHTITFSTAAVFIPASFSLQQRTPSIPCPSPLRSHSKGYLCSSELRWERQSCWDSIGHRCWSLLSWESDSPNFGVHKHLSEPFVKVQTSEPHFLEGLEPHLHLRSLHLHRRSCDPDAGAKWIWASLSKVTLSLRWCGCLNFYPWNLWGRNNCITNSLKRRKTNDHLSQARLNEESMEMTRTEFLNSCCST